MEKIVLAIPDLQIRAKGGHDRKSLKAVEKYMTDIRIDELLYMGDFMDFPQVSRFVADDPETQSESLAADYRVGNAILDRHQKIVRKNNPKAKFTFLMGNHDIRPEKFAVKHPQLKGLVEVEHCLKLKERGMKVVRCYPEGEAHKIGKALFIHGLYTSQNHAKKHVERFGCNIFYGHTHDDQSHSLALWGKGQGVIGQSLGCLCEYEQPYIGKSPKNWCQAVTTFHFRKDGNFNHYVSRIFNHKFTAPNGKTYSA